MLLQERNDLFFRIALTLRFGTPLRLNYREIPHPALLELQGYGHAFPRKRCLNVKKSQLDELADERLIIARTYRKRAYSTLECVPINHDSAQVCTLR